MTGLTSPLLLEQSLFDTFADGFSRIVVGEGSSSIEIPDDLTVGDPVVVRGDTVAEGGDGILINGAVRGVGDASLRFEGPTLLNGVITTEGGEVTFTGPVELALSEVLVDTTDGGTAAGADVRFLSSIDAIDPGGQGLTIEAGNSDVQIVGNVLGVSGFAVAGEDIEVAGVQAEGDIRLSGERFNLTGGIGSIGTTEGGQLELVVNAVLLQPVARGLDFGAFADGFSQIVLGEGFTSVVFPDGFYRDRPVYRSD